MLMTITDTLHSPLLPVRFEAGRMAAGEVRAALVIHSVVFTAPVDPGIHLIQCPLLVGCGNSHDAISPW